MTSCSIGVASKFIMAIILYKLKKERTVDMNSSEKEVAVIKARSNKCIDSNFEICSRELKAKSTLAKQKMRLRKKKEHCRK